MNLTEKNAFFKTDDRYKNLFDESPISILEEDFSAVYKYIESLRTKGITDFQEYFTNNPEQVDKCSRLIKILDVNKATIEMYNANSKEDLLTDLQALFTSDSQRTFIEQLVCIANGETHYKGECVNKTVDGKEIDVYLQWSVTKEYQKDYSVIFVSLIDFTKIKKSEEENRRQREQIRLINRILRHDLANNLAVINSAINNFKRERNDENLNVAAKYIESSSDLISKMREHEFLISSTNLNIYDIGKHFRKILENYDTIEYSVKGKCKIFADDSLNSVIDNLIRNAVVHSGTDRIDIKILPSGKTCEVKVIDYGKGIPDAIKHKIFNEGFKYGITGHSGLGLHIVQRSVKNWGGQILIADNTPKGSIFSLYLRKVN
ncbi:MAG: HAMP domain-containing sensor histidine kinase [Candidatus Tenebribacter mawsonii]|nr:HAMP domain-containing sensor histidine kinase [Candidatus Tenebribacter mawsonii]